MSGGKELYKAIQCAALTIKEGSSICIEIEKGGYSVYLKQGSVKINLTSGGLIADIYDGVERSHED